MPPAFCPQELACTDGNFLLNKPGHYSVFCCSINSLRNKPRQRKQLPPTFVQRTPA
jgi:hypothetical protein